MKALTTTAALALVAASPAQAQTTSADSANWQAVVACAASTGTAERHACIDQVLRTAGVLDPARETAQQRADFGRTPRSEVPAPQPITAPPVAATPPAPSPVAQAPATPAAEAPTAAPAVPQRIDHITTTVAAARLGGNGRLLVATAEATVWRQVDGETFRIAPAAGTPFEVGRGALGSYICTVGRGNSFRCTRVD